MGPSPGAYTSSKWKISDVSGDRASLTLNCLSDHSHHLPLEVGVDNSLLQVEGTRRPYRDLTPADYPNVGTVVWLSLDSWSGERPSSSTSRGKLLYVLADSRHSIDRNPEINELDELEAGRVPSPNDPRIEKPRFSLTGNVPSHAPLFTLVCPR